jgi:hypothetical protein
MPPGYGYILSVNLVVIPIYESIGGQLSLIKWESRLENKVAIRYQLVAGEFNLFKVTYPRL